MNGQAQDFIEVLRQLIFILRFVAELPETLKLLADAEKEKVTLVPIPSHPLSSPRHAPSPPQVKKDMDKVKTRVMELKEAINDTAKDTKKGKTVISRAYRAVKGSVKVATKGYKVIPCN